MIDLTPPVNWAVTPNRRDQRAWYLSEEIPVGKPYAAQIAWSDESWMTKGVAPRSSRTHSPQSITSWICVYMSIVSLISPVLGSSEACNVAL